MKLDVLIRGGTAFDGVSNAGRVVDVGVRSGKIVLPPFDLDPKANASWPRIVEANRVIDATGKFVLPGFIDIHGHSDFAWLIWPTATSKLLAGVTTEVAGNCGYGAFPLAGEVLARRQAEYAKEKLTIDWADAAGYFQRLEGAPCAINRAVLVGQGNVRGVTVGYGDQRARAGQRAAMRRLVAQGMEAGAFGLSSGLIYPPGCFADADELADLAAVVRDHGGFYASHIRDERGRLMEAADEFLDVLARSRCRGQFSHLKTAGPEVWPRLGELGAKLRAARERGIDLRADRYPYVASGTTLAAMLLPPAALEGTQEEILARLTDPSSRRRIADDARRQGRRGRFFDDVRIVSVNHKELKPLAGRSLREIGLLRRKESLEATLDLLVADRLAPEAIHFCMSESNLEQILAWDFAMIGSDSGVRDALAPGELCHPRAFGTPAAFLAHFVRDRHVCDWPTAARKLATMAADQLGLADRGRIAPGCAADLVVLDPAAVADRATYESPRRPPAGIDFVLVNGVVAVEQGRYTGALPGQVLKSI